MNRFWKKKVPAFLLALVMMLGLIPAAAAATSTTISLSVKAGDSISISASKFKAIIEDRGHDLEYVEFTSAGDLDDYGYLEANIWDEEDDEFYEEELDEKALKNVWLYDSSSDIEVDGDGRLSGLMFYADDDADSGTLTIAFTIHDDDDYEVDGTLKIKVSASSSSSSSSSGSTSGSTITYEVKEDDDVIFDAEDFDDMFSEDYDDFSYVKFTASTNLDKYGSLYSYDKDDKKVTFDEDDLGDGKFYYSESDVTKSGRYTLDDLTFVADDDAGGGKVTLKFTAYGEDTSDKVTGSVVIKITDGKSSNKSKYDIVYEVDVDDEVEFDRDDFLDLFEEEYEDFSYLKFTDAENLDDCGYLYSYDKNDEEKKFDEDDLDDANFYYSASDVVVNKRFTLGDLTFVADDDDDIDGEVVVLKFTAYGEDTSDRVSGSVAIEIGDVDSSSSSGDDEDDDDYDIVYTMDEDDDFEFEIEDFEEVLEEEYNTLKYVRFTKATNADECGEFFTCAYDEDDEDFYNVELDEDELLDGYFYADDDDVEDETDCYTLSDLGFSSKKKTDGEKVVLEFTAYESSSKKVTGTLCIKIGEEELKTEAGDADCDILYTTTYGTNVQLNANDFARYFKAAYPGNTLQYVKINGVSSVGGLYYNYYGASAYGTTARTKLTAANCDDQNFYLSPSGTSQYALTELTYVPSGTNYCAAISFTAYGTGSKSITGTVLISVNMKAVPEIYGVVPKNSAVSFPAPSIAAAVATGTSSTFSSIQLLKLPSSKQGTIYVGSGTSRKATATTLYSYADDSTWQISQLRFVPASGFTGSVEIPYAACDKNGTPIAVGKFCLGVVPSVKKFTDVTSTTWCYKYVTELASAGVIDGYADGTYKFNNTVTYGAALKLVMLAAGYPEQAPVNSNVFSGYLAKAISEGIITRTNVDLTKPITRLQMAQLAAGALKLDTTNLSSIKPFTDTNDAHAQALNAAGIIEGYFANGTSTYKPGNNLTRGQMSAIVWRMYNYVG